MDYDIEKDEYMKDWKEVRLGDVCACLDNKRIPLSKKQREKRSGKYPYYGAQGIIDYIDDFIFDGEYLLIAEDGNNVRERNENIARIVKNKFWVNNHAHIILNNERSNLKYLLYYINSMDISGYVTGSAQPKLNQSNMNNLKITLPPLPTQQKIAKILSSLDDKIELNNAINKNLEEIAQTLFKQWFVDFEFPASLASPLSQGGDREGDGYKSSGGEMVESELGLIPKGWRVEELTEFGEVITGKTPPTKDKENYGDKYPFITIPDMHKNVFVNQTERFLSEQGNNCQLNKLIPPYSLQVSCIATVGLVSINTLESHTNQQINSLVPINSYYLYYLYSTFKILEEKLKGIGSSGSTTLNVNKGQFEKIKILYPSDEILNRFNTLVIEMYKEIENNTIETQTLTKLRDELLPKLMSGEVRV